MLRVVLRRVLRRRLRLVMIRVLRVLVLQEARIAVLVLHPLHPREGRIIRHLTRIALLVAGVVDAVPLQCTPIPPLALMPSVPVTNTMPRMVIWRLVIPMRSRRQRRVAARLRAHQAGPRHLESAGRDERLTVS